MARAAVSLPEELRRMIARHGARRLREIESMLDSALRPCVLVTSARVADRPLRRSAIGRMLRLGTASPRLSLTASKFGGTPYTEAADRPWASDAVFIGQINLSEIDDLPDGVPRRGIFAIDLVGSTDGFRVRWYPSPSEQEDDPGAVVCLGTHEASMQFRAGWTLPEGSAWEDAVPHEDEELREAWNEWAPLGDMREECHRLFGHRSAGLDDHYGFEPPRGRTNDVTEYEMLLRITFDNAAGFSWGTNWTYVLVHRDDLAEGRLERAVVTGANY
ncbi:MAG: DUF1963 domain-containing protein [Labilithrix sp.]|nr:DUF1963 domain-containing protein [Labilithrix sp.]